MKYCLKWNNRCKYLKDADEISIKYIEDRGLVDFMEKYSDKRIIIRLVSDNFDEGEIFKLAAIRKQFPEYRFTVGIPQINLPLITKFKEQNVPFYILTEVKDWETLNYYVKELKVSDICLSGAISFELSKVKRFLEKIEPKVVVRAVPNAIKNSATGLHPLQQFFIRPNDIDLYEPYIDVLEFEGIENQDIFYKLYAKEKMFIGKLNQLIYNFPYPIDNLGLLLAFSERRIDCGRECLNGGNCNRCFLMANISKKISPELHKKIQKVHKDKNENN